LSTTKGFWEVAAESKYTSGRPPPPFTDRMGNCPLSSSARDTDAVDDDDDDDAGAVNSVGSACDLASNLGAVDVGKTKAVATVAHCSTRPT